jgi:transposase
MLILTPTELSHLRLVQKTNKNKSDYIKASTILMLSFGDHPDDISARLGISVSTVYNHQKRYSEVPLDEFLKDNYQPYEGLLTPEKQAQLKTEMSQYLYVTTSEVKEFIRHEFAIDMACSSISKMLDRLGFSYKKTRLVPGKADPVKQSGWVEEFQKTISQLAENEIVIFIDAVHPMHNTKSEYGWILRGEDYEILANSGRSRLNINGAINVLNPTEVYIHEADRVNAQSNISLLNQIIKAHPESKIRVFSDNARYNHSRILKEWLSEHPQIIFSHIPAYSPNLNPIERLWKFMKKTVINSYYYETFVEFKKEVLNFFKNITQYEEDLKTLITTNFKIST